MGYSQLIKKQHGPGTLFNAYTAAKTVINPAAVAVIPGGGFLQIYDALRVTVAGAISNIVTTPGTMNFQIRMGPTANIVVFDTGAIQLNATAHVLIPFWLDILLDLRSEGAGTSAQFMPSALASGLMFTRTAGQTDDAQGVQSLSLPAGTPTLGTGFDSTVANLFDLWAGFSINNAGNGVQIDKYLVELLSERN